MVAPTERPLRLHLRPGELGLDGDGLTLRGGAPAVRVLVGTDGNAPQAAHELGPTGAPSPTEGTRLTPAGPQTTWTWRWTDPHGYVLDWTVGSLRRRDGATLQARFHNRSPTPVRLRELTLLRTPTGGLTCDGDPAAWLLTSPAETSRTGHLGEVLPSANELTRRIWDGFGLPVPFELPTDERATDGHWRSFTDVMTLYTDRGRRGLTLGAVGPPVADVRFDCRVEGGSLSLEVVCEMTDVVVRPGESRVSETVLVLARPYDEALETLFRWVAATHGQRTHRGPVTGWCSWYDQAQRITAEHVIEVADAVAGLGDRLPPQVIQIDDGWERQVGDWRCNERFPDGWAPVLERIQKAGATPGIWLAPLAVHDSLGWLEDRPDWFQRDAGGRLVGQADNWGPTSRWLDPTHPGVRKFLEETLRQARRDGFEYFKIDFNEISGQARLYDRHRTRLQAFRDLYQLYREAVGEESYLLACSGLTRGVVGFADAARTGPDAGAVWRAEHPCCIEACIHALGAAPANGILFAADPDVTYLTPRGPSAEGNSPGALTRPEWRTWHSLVGVLGGLAMTSEPLQHPEAARAVVMLEVLSPPAPERGRPLHGGTDRSYRQFGFVATRPWGDAATVVVWNPDDLPADPAVDVSALVPERGAFHVWSFWDEAYLGVHDRDVTVRGLPPHGPALLRLTPVPTGGLPAVVGSTLHLSLGAAEIAGVRATADALTVELTDAGAREGKLFVHSRQPLALREARGCVVTTVESSAEGLHTLSIAARRRGDRQVIRLSVDGRAAPPRN